eukprot:4906228-Ditylum_brightwellii.AAC.1
MMTPVLAGISNRENSQSGGTPMICKIMASQTQPRDVNLSMPRLPAGVYTDQKGCQFQVNAMQCLQISNLEIEENKELCLIDGCSNNSLAEAGMHLFEMAEFSEPVTIIGASDDVQNGIKSLPIGTYCAVVTTATGKHCLLSICPTYLPPQTVLGKCRTYIDHGWAQDNILTIVI